MWGLNAVDGGIYASCALDNMSFTGLILTVSMDLVFIGMHGVITRNFFKAQQITKNLLSEREGKEYRSYS